MRNRLLLPLLAVLALAPAVLHAQPPRGLGINYLAYEGKVLVGGLDPAGPAARAGIRRGDELLAVNGTAVTGADVPRLGALTAARDTAVLRVRRAGAVREVRVARGAFDPAAATAGTDEWLARRNCLEGDCVSGTGRMRGSEGREYRGSFRAGLPQGQGELSFADGRRLRGTFERGAFVEGTLTAPGGLAVQGRQRDGVFVGEGSVRMPDGWSCTGAFAGGRMPRARCRHTDGRTYEGGVNERYRFGPRGKLVSPQATVEGPFDGEPAGEVTMTLPSGTRMVGDMRGGQFRGDVRVAFFDGWRFVGPVALGRDGAARPTGTYYDARGNRMGTGPMADPHPAAPQPPAPPPTSRDPCAAAQENLRRGRDQVVERLRREGGYREVIFERAVTWETRYTTIYLGTPPRPPAGTTSVAFVLLADPHYVSGVGVPPDPELTPLTATRVYAPGVLPRQLFGIGRHNGFPRAPMYVVVMVR